MDRVTAPVSIRLLEGDARRFGEMDLLARLGHGGMAEVFLAVRRERPADLLVLKRLKADLDDPEHRAMFEEESRVMPLLEHPNIVRTTEVGEQAGRRYLAMEFLDGMTLDRCAPCVTELGERAALHVVIELLEGLHYAHELRDQGGGPLEIVHRDVSPHNVFITFEGRVTLVDFGIAKRRGRSNHTTTGVVRGKLAYMAPEQALCETVDRRADVFAAGVVLWELLTGRRFWSDRSDVQILKAMTFGELPACDAATGIRAEVAAVLAKALAPKPEERFESARAFRDELVEIAVGPFKRQTLGGALASSETFERSALGELVRAHLDEARGTAGLLGVASAPPASLPGADVAPPEPAAAEPAEPAPYYDSRPEADVLDGANDAPITVTQSTSALDVRAERRKKRSLAVPIGIGAMLILAAAFVASLRADRGANAVAAATVTASASTDAKVVVKLSVTPADAVVHLDGMRVATLPMDATFPLDRAGHRLTVEAPGYAPKSQIVVFDRDATLAIALSPVVEPDATPSPQPSSAPPPPSGSVVRRAASPSRSTGAGATSSAPGTKGFIEADPWARGGANKPSGSPK